VNLHGPSGPVLRPKSGPDRATHAVELRDSWRMNGDTPAGVAITSTSNPRVKWLAGLQRRRNRVAEGVTLVEGHDELQLALDAGVSVRTLFWCPALAAASPRAALVDRVASSGQEVVALGRAAFDKVSYREHPDGVLAVVPDPTRALTDIELGQPPLLLVCEGVEKPGNLGAMLRTAEAAGVNAVIAADPITDWGNPNVVRASKGTLFAVPVAAAGAQEVLAWLRANRIAIVLATPDAPEIVTDCDLTRACAIVVGAEHEGVSATLRAGADHAVRLPMMGRVNSLNVATAAAITVYEAVRQRLH
jgi:RNA methyltransferase, TrmH family